MQNLDCGKYREWRDSLQFGDGVIAEYVGYMKWPMWSHLPEPYALSRLNRMTEWPNDAALFMKCFFNLLSKYSKSSKNFNNHEH